jgi:hypothetical protein
VATNDRTLKYLKRALTLDPYSRGADIVRLRGKYHRIAAPDDVRVQDDAAEFHNQRMAAHRRVAALRGKFWEVPLALLNSTLAGIDTQRFPDLKPLVERLRLVAELRDDLKSQGRNDPANPGVWELLRTVLVAEGAEAAEARKTLEGRVGWSSYQKAITRAVEHLRAHFPRVYDLDREWLDRLRAGRRSVAANVLGAASRELTRVSAKPRVGESGAHASGASERGEAGGGGWSKFVVVGLALGILRIIVGVAAKSPEKPIPPVVFPPAVSFPTPPPAGTPTYDPSLFAPHFTTGDSAGPAGNPGDGIPVPTVSPIWERNKGFTKEQRERLEAMHKKMRESLKSRERPTNPFDSPHLSPNVPDFRSLIPGNPAGNAGGTPLPGTPPSLEHPAPPPPPGSR